MRRLILVLVVCFPVSAASAQTIVQSRGVDSRVDYASLIRFGPWDDRNYALTAADLGLLADNEAELDNMIPAFFRVELRRRGELPRTGPVQYPLSDLPAFFLNHGGYLVDGKLYRSARRRDDGRFEVLFEAAGGHDDFLEVEGSKNLFVGESRVTSPNGAAESAVAISPANPDLVIAGTNGPSGGQRMHFSTDGGATWAQVELPLGGTCCDPTVGWSSDGSFAYAAALNSSITGVLFYRSADGGQTWDDLANEPGGNPRRLIGGGVSDKEFLHVDISPTSPHQDNIYLTWQQGGTVLHFSRSTDSGHTWSTPLVFNSDPTGIASDITSDADGNIYYSWASFSAQTIVVKKSTDGGVSFAPAVTVDNTNASFNFGIPSQESRQVAVITCLDTDRTGGPFHNSVYVGWSDLTAPEQSPANNHSQVKVAYSRDGGATWTTTIPHETDDVNEVDRWQQWLSVAPDGRVYVAFYDTRNGPVDRSAVDIYFSVSEDGAQTWSAPRRLTTVTSQNVSDSFELGDYNGLDVDVNQLMAIYTDNRDENGGSAQSKDVYVVGFEGIADVLFSDRFESGDTSGWSSP